MPRTYIVILLILVAVALVQLAGVVAARRSETHVERWLLTAPLPHRRSDLPARIAGYVARAIAPGAPLAASVHLSQTARMRLSQGADWQQMTARQTISAGRAGFLWVARLPLGPVTRIRVMDALGPDGGVLTARLFGTIPVARQTGPAMDMGEAQRYLAELPWMPDAMAGNPDLVWRDAGAAGVQVSLDTRGGRATVTLHFDETGDIVRVTADSRAADQVDGVTRFLPWEGRFGDYAVIAGRRIPQRGEVGYHYPQGFELYWQGQVTSYAPELVAPARP